MKKAIVWVLVLCVALLSLTGCKGKKPEKTDAVRAVESQIDALGEITADSSKAITAVLLAYNALTDEEKPLVENYNKLQEAQNRLTEIRAQQKADAEALADLNKTNQKIADIISYTTRKNTDSSVSYTELIATGSEIDAKISEPIVENIFYPKSPLHDGAMVIRNNRVTAAGCILPLTQNELSRELGTRHRAAVGMSEASDALVIVVSEETGAVSVAQNGTLRRKLTSGELLEILSSFLFSDDEKSVKLPRRKRHE